jgi:hypothetical protein
MNEEYLWNRTGEPDPETVRLENLLGELKYRRAKASAVRQALSPVQMWGRRSRLPIPPSTVPPGLESPLGVRALESPLRGESILLGVPLP